MKSLALITIPIYTLVAWCIILNVTWPYYIVAIASGTGLGFLSWLTYLQLRDNSDKPKIKIHDGNKN